MKIIEAMKKVKANLEKINDLQTKIKNNCANLDIETPVYGADTTNKVNEWCQSCDDLSQENIRLLSSIQRTNLDTPVTIALGDKQVTKMIAEWVWRRREYAKIDMQTWSHLTDRGLKEAHYQTSVGTQLQAKIQRHYDPSKRDKMIETYRSEPKLIDAALEVINAITDLKE